MRYQGFRYRVQALFWEHNRPMRALGRRVRRVLSLAAYSLRGRLGNVSPPRVVPTPTPSEAIAIPHPAIVITAGQSVSGELISRFLDQQTELSTVTTSETASNPGFVYSAGEGLDGLPPTHLESLLMAACAEDLDWAVAGWAEPAPGRFGPSGRIARDPELDEASSVLVRLPHTERRGRRKVTGRAVPHLCDADRVTSCVSASEPFSTASGVYRLRHGVKPGSIIRNPVRDVEAALQDLPSVNGPRTALFLLPFLAVGGAEKLLHALVRGLRDRYRVLIATTDPHLSSLGQTVGTLRELTPHVYTLGDWLPPEAVPSALRHLLRRWQVESLVCWNGNICFYDHVDAIKRRFPSIRIINQLYNHSGGWIEHYCPTVVSSTDLHIAINTRIARALAEERAVPAAKITAIHHGVDIPVEQSAERRDAIKSEQREALGLPQDKVVVGTFIRMHPQKRPLDVIRIARKLVDEGVHFLLVGGGPLDASVDDELRRNPPPNLTRLPMRGDVLELYDAIDICLLTSSFEGLPVFLLDGLARAIPCVAPGVGDIPLLLEDGGGIVVNRPGDVDGLVSGIRELMDPDRRRREGHRGRSQVSTRFGVERFVPDYEAVIFPER